MAESLPQPAATEDRPRAGYKRSSETRARILEAALAEACEVGFQKTSVARVAARAGVAVGVLNYHFGSKEALIQEVFARRLGPLNDERLRLLDNVERDAGYAPPPLEAILEAFISPPLRLRLGPDREGRDICRLMGRIYFEPSELTMNILEQFDEVVQRFTSTLARTLPNLSQPELMWRFFFMIGSMAMMLVGADIIKEKTHGICDPSDLEATLHRLVNFASAGIRDPLPEPVERTL